ncbi:hypothetical protein REPUB_Repub02eG0107900 [Reevesia pubescens]
MPKIRIYLWRLVMNILPTLNNLQSRGVTANNICRVCDEGVDSWKHFYFECIYSQRVWEAFGRGFYPSAVSGFSGLDFWKEFFNSGADNGDLDLACCILWQLWKNRNDSYHLGKCKTDVALLKDPRLCLTSINVDVAFSKATKHATIGVVARNADAEVLASTISERENVASSLMGEVYAI